MSLIVLLDAGPLGMITNQSGLVVPLKGMLGKWMNVAEVALRRLGSITARFSLFGVQGSSPPTTAGS